MSDIEKRARELLAKEHRQDQRRAKGIRIGHKSVSRDDHLAVCAIIAALTPQWQPIESAPTQGCILGYCAEDGQFVATWGAPGWFVDTGDSMIHAEPTHWMPLRAPPEVLP